MTQLKFVTQPTDLEPTSFISNSTTLCPPTTWVAWTSTIKFAPSTHRAGSRRSGGNHLLVFIGLGNCKQLCSVQGVVNQANEEEEVPTSRLSAGASEGAHRWVHEVKRTERDTTFERLALVPLQNLSGHVNVRLNHKRTSCKFHLTRKGHRRDTVYGCNVCNVHLCKECHVGYHQSVWEGIICGIVLFVSV